MYTIHLNGTVRYKGHYVNQYDSVSSAEHAIDNGDTDLTIAMKLSTRLKGRYTYIGKLDAISFIKEDGFNYSDSQIVQGWNLAYNEY